MVPVALRGLWGSFFSFKEGFFRNTGRIWSRVQVIAGDPIAPARATAEALREQVSALRGDAA